MIKFRAAKEHFKLEKCVGVDLSEDMLRVAEQIEGIYIYKKMDITSY